MKEELLKQYQYYKSLNLNINMARGKPSKEQLDLSMPMLDLVNSKSNLIFEDNDYRNYGLLDGTVECQRFMGKLMGIDADHVIVYGSSSLMIMHDLLDKSMLHGVCGNTPWVKLDKIRWLCPVPGYDRHFALTESLGIEMINIPMDDNGPDMDLIEKYVKDESVKGIWCIPQYSNPSGITYSDEVVKRFAALKPAAKDFRIYWDEAYISQLAFDGKANKLANIYDEARKNGNEDIVYMLSSTSKMTFPGSGVSALGCSDNNLKDVEKYLKYETICFDKLNQLRHALFFKDEKTIEEHMKKHAALMKPKFDLVLNTFEHEISDLASYSHPRGGFFLSLYVSNKAKEVVTMCKELGVTLTGAGAAYPYHHDPDNSHIRIAPTYLSLEELETATKVICLVIKILNS